MTLSLFEIIAVSNSDIAFQLPVFNLLKDRIKRFPEEVNACDSQGNTPIHLCVWTQQPQLMELLVLLGNGSLETKNANGKTPQEIDLSEHTQQYFNELRKELERRKRSQGKHLHDLIWQASDLHFRESTIALIHNRIQRYPHEAAEKTYWDSTALHLAMKFGLDEIFKDLIQAYPSLPECQDLSGKIPFDVYQEYHFPLKLFTPIQPNELKKIDKTKIEDPIKKLTKSLKQVSSFHASNDKRVSFKISEPLKNEDTPGIKENRPFPFTLILKNNLLEDFLKEGNTPNGETNIGSYLGQTFARDNMKDFWLLVTYGADIKENMQEIIALINKKPVLRFELLRGIQLKIKKQLDKIAKYHFYQRILQCNEEFEREIVQLLLPFPKPNTSLLEEDIAFNMAYKIQTTKSKGNTHEFSKELKIIFSMHMQLIRTLNAAEWNELLSLDRLLDSKKLTLRPESPSEKDDFTRNELIKCIDIIYAIFSFTFCVDKLNQLMTDEKIRGIFKQHKIKEGKREIDLEDSERIDLNIDEISAENIYYTLECLNKVITDPIFKEQPIVKSNLNYLKMILHLEPSRFEGKRESIEELTKLNVMMARMTKQVQSLMAELEKILSLPDKDAVNQIKTLNNQNPIDISEIDNLRKNVGSKFNLLSQVYKFMVNFNVDEQSASCSDIVLSRNPSKEDDKYEQDSAPTLVIPFSPNTRDDIKGFEFLNDILSTIDLLKILHKTCSSLQIIKNPQGLHIINAKDKLDNLIRGLIGKHDPSLVVMCLRMLNAQFNLRQRIICYYVIKGIILYHDYVELKNKFLRSVMLPDFFTLIREKEVLSLENMMFSMLEFNQHSKHHLVKAYFDIEILLSRCIQHHQEDSFSATEMLIQFRKNRSATAKLLADELRAMTLTFYQGLHISHLFSVRSSDTRNSCPYIWEHINQCNKITSYFVFQLLLFKSQEERIDFMSLLIMVLDKLLADDPMPDYDSAMFLNAVFMTHAVRKLKLTFRELDNDMKVSLQNSAHKLSSDNYYRNMHEAMFKNAAALPYFGIFLSQITYAHENQNLELFLQAMGGISKVLLARVDVLRTMSLPVKTTFSKRLSRYHHYPEEYLLKLSKFADPYLMFHENEFGPIEEILDICKNRNAPILIEKNGEMLEGMNAYERIYFLLRNARHQYSDNAAILERIIGSIKLAKRLCKVPKVFLFEYDDLDCIESYFIDSANEKFKPAVFKDGRILEGIEAFEVIYANLCEQRRDKNCTDNNRKRIDNTIERVRAQCAVQKNVLFGCDLEIDIIREYLDFCQLKSKNIRVFKSGKFVVDQEAFDIIYTNLRTSLRQEALRSVTSNIVEHLVIRLSQMMDFKPTLDLDRKIDLDYVLEILKICDNRKYPLVISKLKENQKSAFNTLCGWVRSKTSCDLVLVCNEMDFYLTPIQGNNKNIIIITDTYKCYFLDRDLSTQISKDLLVAEMSVDEYNMLIEKLNITSKPTYAKFVVKHGLNLKEIQILRSTIKILPPSLAAENLEIAANILRIAEKNKQANSSEVNVLNPLYFYGNVPIELNSSGKLKNTNIPNKEEEGNDTDPGSLTTFYSSNPTRLLTFQFPAHDKLDMLGMINDSLHKMTPNDFITTSQFKRGKQVNVFHEDEKKHPGEHKPNY